MRYDNWDAILFPRDSHIPIQEFRTACYVAHDEYGRHLPTLTCYIASLPPSTPFRISVHSWTTKVKPSALIESRRRPNQRVVYTLSVLVDGTRLFHHFYEVSARWPQEIMHEKRSILPSHQSNQQKPPLEFPPFRQNVLMQSCWDSRDNAGRIKVMLSEQLVSKSSNPCEPEFGATNDLVCFLFQHAPRDILEQAGIAWPIRNPLYLPAMVDSRPSILQVPSMYIAPHDSLRDARAQSPNSRQFKTYFEHPSEPATRSNTAPTPKASQFAKPSGQERARERQDIWDDDFTASFGDPLDDISMADTTWSTRRANSRSQTDTSMPDILVLSPHMSKPRDGRQSQMRAHDPGKRGNWSDSMHSSAEDDSHVVVTFREDQLGRLVEAFSPPKPPRNSEPNTQRYNAMPPNLAPSHTYPNKVANMGGATGSTRPSAAAIARTASYTNLHAQMRWPPNKVSPKLDDLRSHQELRQSPLVAHPPMAAKGKENRNPSENRVPTPFPVDTRRPTPHPFLQDYPWAASHGRMWESDTEMRDPSSLFSSLTRLDKAPQQQQTSKESPVPAPSAHGSIKSRKEGLSAASPAPNIVDMGIRHDQSLLPPLDTSKGASGQDTGAPSASTEIPQQSVPADAPVNLHEPQMFIPGHRSGMNSIERVETELFSALGDFGQNLSAASGDNGGLSGLEDFDSPIMKRKRGESLGGDRGKSPRLMTEGGGGEGSANTQDPGMSQ